LEVPLGTPQYHQESVSHANATLTYRTNFQVADSQTDNLYSESNNQLENTTSIKFESGADSTTPAMTNDNERNAPRVKSPSDTSSTTEESDRSGQKSDYWEKRRKNNESAKRSRDARRMKEEQIAMRVVYLEQENLQLRTEASLLKNEIEKLRHMLYSSQ